MKKDVINFMTHIEAVWEKRNLGVDCQEIRCSEMDTPAALARGISRLAAPYQVIRIPAGKADLLLEAQKHSFSVIEVSIDLVTKMGEPIELPKLYRRFEPAVSIHKASEEEQENILNRISDGTMFSTDRVALDPYFSMKASGERYSLWAKDLITKSSAHLSCLSYKDQTVGFSLNYKKANKTYYAVLGGVFAEYAHMGLGFLAIYGNMKSIYEQGGRIVETSVSSNNPPILRLHQLYGYETTAMTYILIKHL